MSSDVILAPSRLASAGASRTVFAVAVTRAATTTAAAGRTAVAVARSVVFALDHDSVVVAVVAVNEECEELRVTLLAYKTRQTLAGNKTYEGDEESEYQDNSKRPAGLEHGTRLVDVQSPSTIALSAVVSKWPQVDEQAS